MKIACLFCLSLSMLGCSHAGPPAAPTQRVIIEYAQNQVLDDRTQLGALSKAAGVELRFIAAISPRSAAYALVCPAADAQCAAGLAQLRAHPGIKSVSPDSLEKIL